MANTILTPTMITREALRILHEKLTFVGKINRDYSEQFGKNGAKIGDALQIRKPARFTVRSGATLSNQDFIETQTTLTLDQQKGVDLSFTSKELTLDLDDFSSRVLEPAMAQLASQIEADALTMINKVQTTSGSPLSWKDFNTAIARLDQQATPADRNRCALVDPLTRVNIVDSLKGLFQDASGIAEQYREGLIGRTAGADWYYSNRMPTVTYPADLVNIGTSAASEGDTTITIAGLTNGEVFEAGTVFTVDGVFAVHPETKKTYTYLYPFVIQADVTAASNEIVATVQEAIYASTTDARQNVSSLPTEGDTTIFLGQASTTYQQNVVFHKDAFTIAFADLVLPAGASSKARESYDGISIRYIEDYDSTNDKDIKRMDVLYGYTVLRPEYACRLVEV